MKKLNITMLSMGIAVGAILSACSTENDLTETVRADLLMRTPDVKAYSANHQWTGSGNSTRGTDVNGNLWYQNWDRPTNVTAEEIAKITELMSTPRVGATNDIHIDWNNYWVQQVYTGEATYVDGFGNNIGTGSSHMNHLLAYSDKKRNQTSWWPVEEFEIVDKSPYEDPYEHVNNFNSGSNSTVYTDDVTGEKFVGTTLMTDMYADGIIDQFGYHNSTDSKNHFEYIIVEMDGSYYICFDFYATHPEGQEANKNMDVERDWIFNDWIVKISPAYHVGETPAPGEPETPGPGDVDTPDPDEPETPDVNKPETPDVAPSVPGDRHDNEVEVNLNGTEKRGDLSSHLSIHVRAATDVKVFIPVPLEYLCDKDDMEILLSHMGQGDLAHGGYLTGNKVTFTVTDGKERSADVTLSIEYVEGGILITTSGITQDVIDICREKYDDGITFEVWNYFNETLDMETLRSWLNQATIEFLDGCPDYYINAFANEEDCTVSIVDSQRGEYGDPTEGPHLNGSGNNQIYENTGVNSAG